MVFTQEMIEAIKRTVAKGATDEELAMFIHAAQKYDLDPILGEIQFISYTNRKTGQKTVRIDVGRDGLIKIANRTAGFKGIMSFAVCKNDEFGIDSEKGEVYHKFSAKDRGPIIGAWAKVVVEGKMPQICFVPFDEYSKNSSNPVWETYPTAMIEKVAEQRALFRAIGVSMEGVMELTGVKDDSIPLAITSKVKNPEIEEFKPKKYELKKKVEDKHDLIADIISEYDGNESTEKAIPAATEYETLEEMTSPTTELTDEEKKELLASGLEEKMNIDNIFGEWFGTTEEKVAAHIVQPIDESMQAPKQKPFAKPNKKEVKEPTIPVDGEEMPMSEFGRFFDKTGTITGSEMGEMDDETAQQLQEASTVLLELDDKKSKKKKTTKKKEDGKVSHPNLNSPETLKEEFPDFVKDAEKWFYSKMEDGNRDLPFEIFMVLLKAYHTDLLEEITKMYNERAKEDKYMPRLARIWDAAHSIIEIKQHNDMNIDREFLLKLSQNTDYLEAHHKK